MVALRTWIATSDELLREAWGSMDRYHLSWLMVGRPPGAVRGFRIFGFIALAVGLTLIALIVYAMVFGYR